MSQFKTDYFKFKGVPSERYNLQIVNIKSDGYESQFGLDRTINSESGVSEVAPVFYGTNQNSPSFDIELFYCDDSGNPKSMSDMYLQKVSKWLFDRHPQALEINGIIYYGMFSKGVKWGNGAKQGYITLTFELSSSVAYSPILITPIRVVGEKIIKIDNKSSYYEDIYPDLECELLRGNNIKITNLTNGKVVEFNGLEDYEHFKVYNDGIRQIVSFKDGKRNLYKLSNKEWLNLVYGENLIKIEGVDLKINIIYQNKIILY